MEHYGQGHLDKTIWPREKEIESFSVKAGGYEITVKPKSGEIFTDKTLAIKTKPGKLVWMLELSFDIHTHDKNERTSPRLSFYSLGIESEIGKSGYKIFEDGHAELGI